MKHSPALLVFAALATLPVADAGAQLRGSRSSVMRQHKVAERNDLTFLRNAAAVREFVRKERLERVSTTKDYVVANVSFPYARPAVKLFIERLARQYRAATGERLVITSLTRPISRQPHNASELSVHPTGIAVDLRVPKRAKSRQWLEQTLLYLEDRAVLDATRERRPPHYHVAVFPTAYERYVDSMTRRSASRSARRATSESSGR